MATGKTPAEVYEEFFVPALFRPCARVLLDAVPPRTAERVLDVACGSGVAARAAAELVGPDGWVTGVELRPGMLAVASSLPAPPGAPVEWREGDAHELELPDASFDLVLCQQGVQFFPGRARAVAEMHRVLAVGGRLGVAVWQGLERQELFRALTDTELRHLSPLGLGYEDVAAPFLFGDAEALRALVAGAGFEDVRVEERSFEARFPADGFVRNLEFAYSAFVPGFVEDPDAFDAFVEAVDRDMRGLLDRHRDGEAIVFPIRVNVATALRG